LYEHFNEQLEEIKGTNAIQSGKQMRPENVPGKVIKLHLFFHFLFGKLRSSEWLDQGILKGDVSLYR
jgi:hypothetical protein